MAEIATQEMQHAYVGLALTSAAVAEKGKRAFLDLVTNKMVVTPSNVTRDMGEFAESRTGDGAKGVMVKLHREVTSRRWKNDGTNPVTTSHIGRVCFVTDASTVSIVSTGGRARAGWVIGVDSLGVRVVAFDFEGPTPSAVSVAPAYVANDSVIPDYPRSGSMFDVPTTAANSTITLPAAAFEGTEVTFVADGTKNGHTVQYRDATGPTALTAALTASKRHQVRAVFLTGKWTALGTVAP